MHPVDLLGKLNIYTAQMIFSLDLGSVVWMTQCTMTTHWRAEAWEVSFWSKTILTWGCAQFNIINIYHHNPAE